MQPHTPRPSVTDEQLVDILSKLPKFSRSKEADERFYIQLKAQDAQNKHGWSITLKQFSWALSSALLLFVIVTTAFSYQDSITRGDLLYPWKKEAEKVEFALAFTSLQKIDAHIRFSDRRAHEAQHIIGKSNVDSNILSVLFVRAAFAQGKDVHLNDTHTTLLALTLQDMQFEIKQATQLIAAQELPPEVAEVALSKVADAGERHVDLLDTLREKGDETLASLLDDVAGEEEAQVALVVEARETAQEAREKRIATIKIKFATESNKRKEDREQRALSNFQEAVAALATLPTKGRAKLSEKVNRAKEALEKGKLGKGIGLSQAVINEITRSLPNKTKANTPASAKKANTTPSTSSPATDKKTDKKEDSDTTAKDRKSQQLPIIRLNKSSKKRVINITNEVQNIMRNLNRPQEEQEPNEPNPAPNNQPPPPPVILPPEEIIPDIDIRPTPPIQIQPTEIKPTVTAPPTAAPPKEPNASSGVQIPILNPSIPKSGIFDLNLNR